MGNSTAMLPPAPRAARLRNWTGPRQGCLEFPVVDADMAGVLRLLRREGELEGSAADILPPGGIGGTGAHMPLLAMVVQSRVHKAASKTLLPEPRAQFSQKVHTFKYRMQHLAHKKPVFKYACRAITIICT